MTTVASLCQSAQALQAYGDAVQKYGATCQANGRTLSADDIADTCSRAFLGQWANASGVSPGERKKKRQQRNVMRASYAASLSETYQLTITPKMIGMGLLGIAIAFFGGIPMLLLSIASVVFEHLFEQQILNSEGMAQAASAMGAA